MSEAGGFANGLYADGLSAALRPVRARIEADALVIVAEDGAELARWPLKKLQRYSSDAQGRLRLGSRQTKNSRLTLLDSAFEAVLEARAPHLFRASGLRTTMRLVLIFALVSTAVIAAAYAGLPFAAERLAPLIPPALEARIGARYAATTEKLWPACPLDERATNALGRLTVRLLGQTDVPFDISVEINDMKLENAFALPGGHIIITHRLIAQMQSPDELAGVLAHELGHVVERHAMIGVIQDTSLNTLLTVLTGGGSGSGEWIVHSAGTLASLSYSRRLEARADARGLAMLETAGISPQGYAQFFERLTADEKNKGETGFPTILRTHPPSPARAAAARHVAGKRLPPALGSEDWAALKAVCSAPEGAAITPPEPGLAPKTPAAPR